ncbi:LysR substrate-binding domain-containing protein [Streptomyces hokutonensis]|uniref:LysR substrate-binding domain-containing protein n=1 Tax=Streptomyces hokutonensis TaxID=1306990 RepID=UPI0033CEF2AC
MRAGRHHLVIITRRPRGRALESAPLADEEYLLVASPVRADGVEKHAQPDDLGAALSDVPMVTYAEDLPIVRRYWRSVFGQQLTTRAAVTVPNPYAVLSAVNAGAGFNVRREVGSSRAVVEPVRSAGPGSSRCQRGSAGSAEQRVMRPKPVFVGCDEAVSALDPSVQAQVLNLPARLKHTRGLSCLFVSHDLSVVRYLSNTIVVLYAGRVVERPRDRGGRRRRG